MRDWLLGALSAGSVTFGFAMVGAALANEPYVMPLGWLTPVALIAFGVWVTRWSKG